MKNFKLFFLSVIFINFNFYIQSNERNTLQHSPLQKSCAIKTIHEKLKHANSENPKAEDIIHAFKQLYDECKTVINEPGLPPLTTQEWIQQGLSHIKALKEAPDTRKCFNIAADNLTSITTMSQITDEQSNQAGSIFLTAIQNCSEQYAQNLSLLHLDAAIKRWENNLAQSNFDTQLFKLYLKHSPQVQNDFSNDIKTLHQQHFDENEQSLDQVASFIQNKLKLIQNNPQAHECFKALIDFKAAYFATDNQEEKDKLKKDFAILYFQCKNL